MILQEDLLRAKNITKYFGRGFYRASFLFPKTIREATWILYAFVRLPDEMVDSEPDKEKARKELQKYSADWASVLRGEKKLSCDTILFATKEVFDTYKIPYEYSDDFLQAMHQDLIKESYATYQELEEYMYSSAAVVGLMMSHLMGFKDGALQNAKALGEAFQLVNFLRDIKDDYDTRGRIYLPREDMEKYAVTEVHIKNSNNDFAWKQLMSFEIERAKKLLEIGRHGIPMLHNGRRAVYASYLLYKELIKEIERKDFDIFSQRVVVSPMKKTMLLLKALWKRNL